MAGSALWTEIRRLAPDERQARAALAALLAEANDGQCGHEPERCYELAVAWGCGWRSVVTRSQEQPWPKAVLALAQLSEPLVGTVLRQLDEMHLPSPASERILALRHNRDAGERSFASMLALDLVASQGLDGWKPEQHRLSSYLLRLFGGRLDTGALRSAAFTEGLLYPLLREELGLLSGTVAFLVCHSAACHAERIHAAITQAHPIKVSELGKVGLFEGNRCSSCGQHAEATSTYRLLRRHWLLVPRIYGGAYEERMFMNCTACGHHFPCSASYMYHYETMELLRTCVDEGATTTQRHFIHQARKELRSARSATACPLCQRHAVSQRPVQLWVYAPTKK
ncbi:hypothetical protein [Candidatus Chloroploca sp. Khr17]|uniref:hypothetical protein n=1 Tax=Candidatus Chloroploca sp. Khr17 TaxID=2496869 RepID=UPI00101C610E|nr:hypothetical protein [Candidatus Chloroploca sp. Khr17]